MYWLSHVPVAAVVQKEDRFLLAAEPDIGRVALNQPAGHLKQSESPIDVVHRERLEKTGSAFAPQYLPGICHWQNKPGNSTHLRFAFTGELPEQRFERPPDQEISAAVRDYRSG